MLTENGRILAYHIPITVSNAAEVQTTGEKMFKKNQSDNLHELFIQNVSHELKTPLAVMLGFTQLLREGDFGELAPEQEQAAMVILDRAEALRNLVERISLLISVEGQENVFSSVNLPEVVDRSVAKAQETAKKSDLTVKVMVDEEVTAVTGDLYRLENMVDCLLDNAIKFNRPHGKIDIQLYTEAEWVCLTVTDTGIGISPTEIEQILGQRFYQVDGSMTRRYGGLGLGLTLVKSIVQTHRGHLEIVSQPDDGSSFTVKLPLTLLPGEDRVMPAILPVQRVLVVDDEENVGLIVQKGLKKLPNCEIKLARSADQALAFCEEAPFDLMITDYMMPGKDGIALASQIRQMYPQTVILMLTAHNNEELHQQASQVAVQRILNKPVEIAEIRQAVSQALEQA